MRVNMKKSMLIIAIVAVLVCAVTAVSFAAWSNKLEPSKDFEISAGKVTHLEFGGSDGIVIAEKIEPNKTVTASVMLKSTAETLLVEFSVPTVLVRLKGESEYRALDEADNDIITMETITKKTISIAGATVVFKFKMKQKVDFKYAEASFKFTVKATGSVA